MSNKKINKKSILIISHSYKPFINPRAFRWTTLAEQFVKQNYNVDIITSWKPGLAREEIINGVNIFRVGGSTLEKLRHRFSSTDNKKATKTAQTKSIGESTIKRIIKSSIHFVHDNTWKKIYWPDYASIWKKPAIESALYLLENEKYDKLITVSDPFTSHLVGQEIKQQHLNLFWLVDIGDPFCFRQGTQANNYALYHNKNISVERNIFAQADSISVTNENTKIKYSELFPESENKIDVMLPLLSGSESNLQTKKMFTDNDKIRLIFIGTLYKQIRNPRFLLSLFDKLMNSDLSHIIELHFFGGINDTRDEFSSFDKYLDSSLFVHGIVPRETVIRAMNEASLLVNIGNDNIYQLPSKLVEYMDTGNPILNIACVNEDISDAFLGDYESKLTLQNNYNNLADSEFDKCLTFLINLPKKLSTEQQESYTYKFKPEIIASQYLKASTDESIKQETAIMQKSIQ